MNCLRERDEEGRLGLDMAFSLRRAGNVHKKKAQRSAAVSAATSSALLAPVLQGLLVQHRGETRPHSQPGRLRYIVLDKWNEGA